MIEKKQIEDWITKGIISPGQAALMISDTARERKERTSGKLIAVISTIGSLLLGTGVILFVASNWQHMSSILKTSILIFFTGGAYFLGYKFKYQDKNFIKVGGSLIFLASLLFGATIFIIAQIYNVNANNNTLVLIWLVAIIPLMYALKTRPVAVLVSILFFIWIGLFAFRNMTFSRAMTNFSYFPVLYLVSGILLFNLGELHYLSDKFKQIGRIFRILGLKIGMSSLFLLTFKLFSSTFRYEYIYIKREIERSGQLTSSILSFSMLSIIIIVINRFIDKYKLKYSIIESVTSFVLIFLSLIFFLCPVENNIFVLIFNFVLVGIILLVIFIGYDREDITLVNLGMYSFFIYFIARYFDIFWNLFSRSIFFMVGGFVLILGGLFLEFKRREIKEKFGGKNEK